MTFSCMTAVVVKTKFSLSYMERK